MTTDRRLAVYLSQSNRRDLTARQRRRLTHKARRAQRCPDCWAETGERHTLSCPATSDAEFRAEMAGRQATEVSRG